MKPIRRKTLSLALTAACAALLIPLAPAQGIPVDLSNWQVIQYELNNQPDSNWALQPGNAAVLQTINSDASLFVSDFDAAGQEIRGTFSVQTSSDDDFIGFVFGYQDRSRFYLFDWKGSSQTFGGLFAEEGMSIKVVETPAGTDPTFGDLWPTAGSPNVTVLDHNNVPWSAFTEYEFVLLFTPGTIEITVSEAGQPIGQFTSNDSTFTSGEFGFYNFSQGDVLYQGFAQMGVPEIYCVAKENSSGCTPSIAFTGFASLTDPAPFEVSASELINQAYGTLMYGLGGRDAVPFFGGTLCIMGPRQHTPLQLTGGNTGTPDCSGTLALDFNNLLQNGGTPGVMAGSQVNAQFFYRDVTHLDGTGYGLTDGVEFFILP